MIIGQITDGILKMFNISMVESTNNLFLHFFKYFDFHSYN